MSRTHSAFYVSVSYALPHCNLPQVFAQPCAQFLSSRSDYFPAPVFVPSALHVSSGMAGKWQANAKPPLGKRQWFQKTEWDFFPAEQE